MSDTYSSIITNKGESTVLQNTVNAYTFRITKIEVGSRANLDLNDAMTWENMASGNVVYTVTGEQQINDIVRKIQLDETTVQFRVNFGVDVGGDSSSGMVFGCIGLYLQGYDEVGTPVDKPVLFAVGSLGVEFVKYSEASGSAGNSCSFYLSFKITNKTSIDNILIAPTECYSLPTVDTEQSKYLNDYFNTYIVNNYDNNDVSAIAFKTNKNSESFTFALDKNETAARMSLSGIYLAPKQDTEDHRLAYYTGSSSSGYNIHLSKDVVVRFPKGFESDGSYRHSRYTLTSDMMSENVLTKGYYTVLFLHDEDHEPNYYLKIVNSEYVFDTEIEVESPEEEGLEYFWFDRHLGLAKKLTFSETTIIEASMIARFTIDNSLNIVNFTVARPFDYVTGLEYELLLDTIKKLKEEFASVDATCLHKINNEMADGIKTFIANGSTNMFQPAIIVKNTHPNINLQSTSNRSFYSAVNSIDSVGKPVSTVLLERGKATLATWSEQEIGKMELPVTKDVLETSEFISINGESTDTQPILQMSDNVYNSLMQNWIATYNKSITLAGSYTFAQDVTVHSRVNATATSSLWADLAEYYTADEKLPVGTLVTFGGDKDITISKNPDNVEAIISDKPGLILNASLEGGENKLPVALVGQTPVRVIGKVEKGDYIYHSKILEFGKDGVAIARKYKCEGKVILGKALESNDALEEKLVNCVVRLTF